MTTIYQSSRNYFNKKTDNGKNMGPFTHIISIVCPDEKELITPISNNHLIVKMWDVDKVLKNKFRRYDPPSEKDLHNILLNVMWWFNESCKKNEDFRLLIHCDAGLSRSPAITLGVLWYLSSMFFAKNVDFNSNKLRRYIEARTDYCKSLLEHDFNYSLRWYIDKRFNPGVKPNTWILKVYRDSLPYFPW